MTHIQPIEEQGQPQAIYLSEYCPPDYRIDTVELRFDLGETETRVSSRLLVVSQHDRKRGAQPLILDGHDMQLVSVALDGEKLAADRYVTGPASLAIADVPERFVLEIETIIKPQDNTSLMGLYKSSGNFCTQCEAEGFRKMTYFIDRPDVMARYTTTLVAERARYPVLLSNGNCTARGELEGGRHYATWRDPFPKPSYLFALVAGDLTRLEDEFVTRSGRRVQLHMFVQQHNADRCQHAMESLQRAMRWDEEVYGREYDLDVYMVVAVDDFNMGAMENKGLNVFNSKFVLARPETATDIDYIGIESVIGHEYFHNWSGNRVTCRDWFQLSLKEGFTVFRDQEFSADMGSRGVKRIQDVNVLRSHQFREDAGPMAHPVRPASYVEINNFYTMTVYNKGAEVVRMLHRLLGADNFRRGTDLYFDRHDGQAVTTDDFVTAMEDANDADFAQFRRWYSQAGTPTLHVSRRYDPATRRYTLQIRQSCPPTPGQPQKEAFHMPFAIGLLDANGNELPLTLAGEAPAVPGTRVLALRDMDQTFVFTDVPLGAVPSLLRGFSAPVKVESDLSDGERCFLMAHDTDLFNRWEAGQQLAVTIVLRLIDDLRAGRDLQLDPAYLEAMRRTLTGASEDKAMIAQIMTLPSESYVAEFMPVIDPQRIHEALRFMRAALAGGLRRELLDVHAANADDGPYRVDAQSVGQRSLRNVCLSYLMELDDAGIRRTCMQQFRAAGNMTDVMAALHGLANTDCDERVQALAAFHDRWRDDPLVMDKWLAIQATSRLPGTLAAVKQLMAHPVFNIRNPNKVRSLIGSFCSANPRYFHDASGEGYVFLGDFLVQLDPINPQVAARLVSALSLWRRYDEPRQRMMRQQLQRIQALPGLSRDVYEIVSKSLAPSVSAG